MSILISGMDMPRRVMVVNIYADGRVTNHFDEFGKTIGKAVPVPPHGRLGDLDALTKKIKRDGIASDPFVKIVCDYFKDAPTIIEAEVKQ